MRIEKYVLDHLLRDHLPVLAADLEAQDLRHTCGAEYELYWLERDGQLLQYLHDLDALECVLCAMCVNHRQVRYCCDQETAFNYLKVRVTGHVLAAFPEQIVIMLMVDVRAGWEDLKRHLETVSMPSWDRAIMRALEDELCNIRPNYLIANNGDWIVPN